MVGRLEAMEARMVLETRRSAGSRQGANFRQSPTWLSLYPFSLESYDAYHTDAILYAWGQIRLPCLCF